MVVGEGEEKKLELRLGLPCQEHVNQHYPEKKQEKSLLSLGSFYTTSSVAHAGAKRGILESSTQGFTLNSSGGVESKKANGKQSEDRTASVAAVGWPPIRSFRKNLAFTSKPSTEPHVGKPQKALQVEKIQKGSFVKITMDGIPIGRKVDLKSIDTYEMLSLAVDELFRALLAAQKDPPTNGPQKSVEEMDPISGILDGSGEYTLVYQDDEGDWMLVGDVPWDMFVFAAKKLRVLKTSQLSRVSLGEVIRKTSGTK